MAAAQILAASCLLCALAAGVCAWCVYRRGLVAVYPAFFSYLISQFVLFAVSSRVTFASAFYVWTFIVVYPLVCGIYCLMVRELYNQIFNQYPGIAMFGKWSIYLAIVLAIGMAIASRGGTRTALVDMSAIVVPLEVAGRDIVFGLALSIVILLLLISRYPLDLHKNVFVNCAIFSAVLLVETAQILIDHATNFRYTLPLDVALMLFNFLCFGIWGFLLDSQGAISVVHLRHGFSKNDERRLLEQLSSLNALGNRVVRK